MTVITSDLQALRSDQCASAEGAVPAVSIGGVSPRNRLSSCASTPVTAVTTAERAGSPPPPGRPQHGTEARTWPRGKAATGRWHHEAWGLGHGEAGPGSQEHAAVPSLLSRLAAAAAEPSAAFARAAVSKPSGSSCSRAARGLAGASFSLDPLALRRLGGEGVTRVGSAS